MEHFKRNGFSVFSFCLKKINAHDKAQKEDLLIQIASRTLDSETVETENKEKRNYIKSSELREFIEKRVIPKM